MSPVWYLVLPTLAVVDIAIGITAISLPDAMRDTVIDATHRSSVEMANQFKLTRDDQSLYLSALQKRNADANSNTQLDTNMPSIFHLEYLRKTTSGEVNVISATPYLVFNTRKGQMDDFQANAWEAFQENSSVVYERLEIVEGQRSLRVAVADHMTDSICISCHNSNTQSGKRDWKIGDVSAVL